VATAGSNAGGAQASSSGSSGPTNVGTTTADVYIRAMQHLDSKEAVSLSNSFHISVLVSLPSALSFVTLLASLTFDCDLKLNLMLMTFCNSGTNPPSLATG
jgi:hypothetical protein